MAFPTSNLPSASVPWGREVEKQVSSLAASVKSNEVNNTARDNQLASNYKRLDAAVVDIAGAVEDAADAAAAAGAAASTANAAATTANNAANAALAAANTANSAIAILSSLTTATYYPGTSTTWSGNNLNGLIIDYYGSTYIDIPEPGGSRKVIVTAVFDVDMNTTTAAAATATSQSATARMYGTSTATNSISGGGSRGSNAGNIGIYGGGSLTVTGTYDVTSSGTLSWNPDLTIITGSSGTFSGSANLRFVTVIVTKV
jgi:hypothetical protein